MLFFPLRSPPARNQSAENFLTLDSTFLQQGIDPLVYRFAAFLTHYRKPMEYSDESVEAARNGLQHLRNQLRQLKRDHRGKGIVQPQYRDRFLSAINDDLNMPRAMAVVQETLKAELSAADRVATALDFDRVLGLDLAQVETEDDLPAEVKTLADERIKARQEKNWEASDRVRKEIEALGFVVQDTKDGMKVFKQS